MDMEAIVDTLRTEMKEKAKDAEIQKQNEAVDKWWDEYAQDFTATNFSERIEDQIGISVSPGEEISYFSESVQRNTSNANIPTQQSHVHPASEVVHPASQDKGKQIATPDLPSPAAKKPRGRPKKTTATNSIVGRIYHNNRGRSERIANQKKPFVFDKYATGSTPDKAFDVE